MDIHALEGDGNGKWNFNFHYVVPDDDNVVNESIRAILVISGRAVTSMTEGTGPGQISTAEKSLIEAGEVFEHPFSFYAESGASTNQEMQDAVKAQYARLQSGLWSKMQERLKYYGWAGDLP